MSVPAVARSAWKPSTADHGSPACRCTIRRFDEFRRSSVRWASRCPVCYARCYTSATSATASLTGSPRGGLVVVSVPENEGESASRAIATLLGDRLKGGRLESLSKGEDATVISYAFASLPADAVLALQTDLAKTSAGSTVNIFFHRSAAI